MRHWGRAANDTGVSRRGGVKKDGILLYNFLIEWDDLVYQKNYNRLTINSRSNTKIWANLHYTETDNVQLLMSFLEWKFENQ